MTPYTSVKLISWHLQLAAVEQAVAARKGELEELLASHKAVQLAKDSAKAELALVEQQLKGGRAARDAQLQQHSALVHLQAMCVDKLYGEALLIHLKCLDWLVLSKSLPT